MSRSNIDINWFSKCSFRLQTVDPNNPLNDLEPMKAMVGSARIVGMGEATHGSKEFTLVRYRILKFLVDELGFNGLILETPKELAKTLNTYIKTGKGNAKKLLSDLGYWVHNTQEILNVIEWMRTYNQQNPTKQISFYGCDIPQDDKRRFDEFSKRDKAMAENCVKILQELGNDSKVVLWSHNFHIYHPRDLNSQGSYLKQKLGKDYYALISLFNRGKFNAFLWDTKTEKTKGFKTFSLKPAHDGTYEYLLASTEQPLAIFDIQKVKNQSLADENKIKKYKVREVGSVFTPANPESFEYENDLLSSCDGIIWVNTISAATSLWH